MPAPNPESVSAAEPQLPSFATAGVAPRGLGRSLLKFLALGAGAIVSYYLIAHFFLQSVTVVGVSMLPTLHDSQSYLLNRWIYHVRAPHCTDVVVLRDPSDNGYSVKRIVAVAGDSVCVKDGGVYVNGRRIAEPYLSPGTRTFSPIPLKEQMFKCGADQFFVLGDNRNNSIDSRAYGPIPRRNILGLVIR